MCNENINTMERNGDGNIPLPFRQTALFYKAALFNLGIFHFGIIILDLLRVILAECSSSQRVILHWNMTKTGDSSGICGVHTCGRNRGRCRVKARGRWSSWGRGAGPLNSWWFSTRQHMAVGRAGYPGRQAGRVSRGVDGKTAASAHPSVLPLMWQPAKHTPHTPKL